MFPKRYFAPGYFAPVYFPPVDASEPKHGGRGRGRIVYDRANYIEIEDNELLELVPFILIALDANDG